MNSVSKHAIRHGAAEDALRGERLTIVAIESAAARAADDVARRVLMDDHQTFSVSREQLLGVYAEARSRICPHR